MKNRNVNLIIPLAMVTALAGGGVLFSASVNADSENSHNSSENTHHSSDSNERGSSSEAKKIIICHVPKGNPANKHTIHIGFSAWPAHRDNHGGDWLGSCNNPPHINVCYTNDKGDQQTILTNKSAWLDNYQGKTGYALGKCTNPKTQLNKATSNEDILVIKDCKGDYRKKLVELTQSYFDPLIVNDDALDDSPDEDTLTAVSECLDKGDSSDSSKSDSGKNKQDSGKGGGHDSVSDSGKHHRISSCKNRDSSESHKKSGDSKESDSSKNYHKKLEQREASFNSAHSHGDSSLNISDSSMDDSGVYTEYKKCVDSNANHKGDSGKGDSGHKYRIMNNCSNAQTIKAAIKTHKEKVADADSSNKYLKRPVIIKTSSLTDTRIKTAVDACLDPKKGGGTQETLPPSDPTGHTGYNGRLNWREITNP